MLAVDVGTRHTDADRIANGVDSPTFAATQAVVALVKFVVVTFKVAKRHHSLTFVFVDLDVQTEFRDATHLAVEFLTDTFSHELDLFVLDAGAFCLGCELFHRRGVFAEFFALIGVHRPSAGHVSRQEAVDHRVGIAAYR